MGSTDIGVAYATGRAWFRVPQTINVRLAGTLPSGVYTKDVTLEMVRRVGVDGANYRTIEYTGTLVEQMPVSERLTLCNMTIEMGGKAGIVYPAANDQTMLSVSSTPDYPPPSRL